MKIAFFVVRLDDESDCVAVSLAQHTKRPSTNTMTALVAAIFLSRKRNYLEMQRKKRVAERRGELEEKITPA